MRMKVRVIVATLGERPSLERTLKSIVNQEIFDLEVKIVVPVEKIHYISDLVSDLNLKNFQIIEDQKKGFSAAINQGWSAEGDFDYFCWINDDDELTDGSILRSLISLDSDSKLSAVVGNLGYFRSKRVKIVINKVSKFTFFVSKIGPNIIPQPGSLIRQDKIKESLPLNENYKYAMDLDLWLKILREGKIGLIRETQALMFWHTESITVINRRQATFEAFQIRYRNAKNIFIKLLILLFYIPTRILSSLISKLS